MSRPAHKISRKKKCLKLEPLEPRTLFSADILSAGISVAPQHDTLNIDLLSSEWADSLRSLDGNSTGERPELTTDETIDSIERAAVSTSSNIEHRSELSDVSEEMAVIYAPTGGSTNVIQVSTTDDVIDGDTSSFDALILNSGSDGVISLREAIIAANNQPGTDTIRLSQGSYTLSILGKYEDLAATGDLDISSDIILEGTDSSTTFISANTLDDRLFEIHPAASLIASNITLQDGGSTSTPGGAVHNQGDLTLSSVSLINNMTDNTQEAHCGIPGRLN